MYHFSGAPWVLHVVQFRYKYFIIVNCTIQLLAVLIFLFFLLHMLVSEKGVLKSPTKLGDFSVFPFALVAPWGC